MDELLAGINQFVKIKSRRIVGLCTTTHDE